MHERFIVGGNIKKWRSFKGFKQVHLAEKIGISRITLSKYENGRSEISYMQLQLIALALDVRFEELVANQ